MAADFDLTSTTTVFTSTASFPIGTMIPAEGMIISINYEATVYQNVPLTGGGGGSTRPTTGMLYPRKV